MQIHLVRHGQTRWNAERRIQGQLDTELDETGREQARALAPTLAALDVGAVYCSTSVRTRQTAALALAPANPDIVYRDELREIRLGAWEGRLWSEVELEDRTMTERLRDADPAFEVENAEGYPELQRRGVAAIERIIGERAADVVLVVSHGALIKSVLAHYTDEPLGTLRSLPSLPNCAHSVLEADGDGRRVTRIGGEPIEETPWGRGSRSSRTSASEAPAH